MTLSIRIPHYSFETEAQREAPSCPKADAFIDPSEAEGWVNVRQVLSFDLGSHPHFQPQMAYVLRVRRGRQPTTKNPPTLSIAEWMEFAFRGADNTGRRFCCRYSLPRLIAFIMFSRLKVHS